MSGNEITGIRDFFEENSSHHQSQVAGSGHTISNNSNPWIGTHSADPGQVNVKLPFQTPFGVDLSQIRLKQHIERSPAKDQQLNLNELMHAPAALQGSRSVQQVKVQREGAFPDSLGLMQRGFANFGSQDGSSPSYGPGFPGSLEKPDVAASPVSYDFLGAHQHQHLSGQYMGIPQPHPRQLQCSNEMQLRQHLLAMQMQEIQRQQHLQQLHYGARQHNSFNQMYGAAGALAVSDEFPGMLSGMPIGNAAGYMPGEFMTAPQSRPPPNSHMYVAGNMNWAHRNVPMMQGMPNGLIYSQDQGQAMNSMGYATPQFDQSLHGTPVSGGMGSLNHYFQLQGMPNDCSSVDLMSKLGENHVERASLQPSRYHNFQSDQCSVPPNEGYSGASFVAGRQDSTALGKNLFGNASVQGTDSGGVSGSIQDQEFQDGQEDQTDWLGKPHESITAQAAPSHTVTNLDSTEEKILFGDDDSANWDTSLRGSNSSRVAGTFMNGYPMQNNDCLNTFPSIQSGTWSALVQEALEVSSSDTGQQEEWSGLALQKAVPQTGRHLALMGGNGKLNAVRDDECDLNDTWSRKSKPFPLSNDATASQNCHSVLGDQHPINNSNEHNERLETDLSIHSAQQLSSKTQFAQNHQPYDFIGNDFQERQQQLNSHNGSWMGQEHQQALPNVEIKSNSQGMQHSWMHQQKMPFYNMNSQSSNKLSNWGVESPSSSGSRNFKNDENGDLNQIAQNDDIHTPMNIEMTRDRIGLRKISESKEDAVSLSSLKGPELADFMNPNSSRPNMMINQQFLNRKTADPFKHVAGHLFAKDKEAGQTNDKKQLSTCPQEWNPSLGYTHKEPGESHGHSYNSLNTGLGLENVRNEIDNALLSQSDHLHLISGAQKLSDLSDVKSMGSHRSHFQTGEQGNHVTNKLHSQGLPHPSIWGLKNHDQETFQNTQVIGQAASTNSIDLGKDCFSNPEKASALAELSNSGKFPRHNHSAMPSFSATTGHFSQDKRACLPSQNAHNVFEKMDKSDDCNSAAKQNISENNSSSGMPDGATSEVPLSHLQHSQMNLLHGTGLKLPHPSQRQSMLGSSFITHPSAESTHLPWLSPSPSALPAIHETSRIESSEYNHVNKNTLYSNTKGSSLGVMMNDSRNQHAVQQLQQQSYTHRQAHFDQSTNHSFGNNFDADSHPKHIYHHPPQAQDHHDQSPATQTSQPLFPGMPTKAPASRLTSPLPSQFCLKETNSSEMINTSSDSRNASQLHQVVEAVSSDHPSAAAATSQQARYFNILNNSWRNSASQETSGPSHLKFPSNLLQPLNSLEPFHQDAQSTKKGDASSEAGTLPISSLQFSYGDEENSLNGIKSEQNQVMVSLSEVQEQVPNLANRSSAVSISSSVHVPQQDKKGKHVENQRENPTFLNVSPSSSDTQKNNYSLLQQMQAMKGTDSDASKVGSSMLIGTDLPTCRGLDAGFQSMTVEQISGNASSRPASFSGQLEVQNSAVSSSVFNLTETNERHLTNPQMTPSWFDHYENIKDSQTSGMHDSLGTFQRSIKAAAQHSFYSKTCEKMDNDTIFRRRIDTITENSSPTDVTTDCHSSPQLKVIATDEIFVSAKKKPKLAPSDLISWHNEATQSSRCWQNFSLAKVEWARATNRMIEKVEDDTETMDDLLSVVRPKRRLVLTTHLMQQLLSPVPAKFLFEDSVLSYEKVIYCLTKRTLGEVCSLISALDSESGSPPESITIISEKHATPKRKREEVYSNIVDSFVARFRNLQKNFFRFECGSSILDYRMECQDVERGSIINRFAKFHGRSPAEVADCSSNSEIAPPRRLYPQRGVTVVPMPRNLPDGLNCLSL